MRFQAWVRTEEGRAAITTAFQVLLRTGCTEWGKKEAEPSL